MQHIFIVSLSRADHPIESKDGCPICLSTSNTQAKNKSIISENGLVNYSGSENEVLHGIHHIHEADRADKSRGLQHMSQVWLCSGAH
jgi:vacuolar protein sorting-associated protein 8